MNRWRESVQVALLDIRSNPLRSALSLSGVLIGIASVTVILAFGVGMREAMYERLVSMGLLEYQVRPGYNPAVGRVGKVEMDDVGLLKTLPFVQAAYANIRMRSKNIRAPNAGTKADVLGMDEEALKANPIPMISGRSFLQLELENRLPVCLLSDSIVPDLFSDLNPLGKTVWIENIPWEVVGVFSAQRFTYQSMGREPKFLVLPARASMRLYEPRLESIVVHVVPDFKGKAAELIQKALGRGDPQREKLFQVSNWTQFVQDSDKNMRTMAGIGALIASIALLVGEIGIMNVILTSVAERTREIGLRRALGARKVDILVQFLTESGLFSGLGGILGVLGGIAFCYLSAPILEPVFQTTLRIKLVPAFLILEIGVASALGVLFGVYPALKATRISPAEALRTE